MTVPFNALTSTKHGTMLYHRCDAYVGRSLDLYGEFSPEESDFLCQLVGLGSVVIDGGANIGALTVPLAKAVGPQGVVFAIEPQRLTFQALCANVALNSLSNVRTIHAALGRMAGEIPIPQLDLSRPQNVGGFSVSGYTTGEPTPRITIDSLKLPGVSLIKLDLEGMEREALDGAANTIRLCAPMLYVESDRKEQRDDLIRDLKGFGYRLFWHCPPLFRANNYRRVRDSIFGEIVSVNILALPPHDTRDLGLDPVA